MLFPLEFRKSIFISLSVHLIIFGMFTVSFSTKPLNYADINFNGALLSKSDLAKAMLNAGRQPTPGAFAAQFLVNKSDIRRLDNARSAYNFIGKNSLKPAVSLAFNNDKIILSEKLFSPKAPGQPSIMFYPGLPRYFDIYFKDRQFVHIELLFKIISKGPINAITVNRKISSGNLEADLLSIRYISQYLFLQQMRFPPDKWQTVKIDLSLKR